MKKIIFSTAFSMLSILFVYGQSRPDSIHSQTTIQSTTSYQSYPSSEMKKVNTADLPAPLQKTLADPGYEGWENSTFYYNSASREYSYQPVTSSSGIKQDQKNNARWIHFDHNGKRKPDEKE